mmetsp:Transcript_7888/g.14618  ORF Transcript_7888/g.14618 Transcript_7888/m.14618 type:complete len:201 (+) Transcript_7888:2-604(+)
MDSGAASVAPLRNRMRRGGAGGSAKRPPSYPSSTMKRLDPMEGAKRTRPPLVQVQRSAVEVVTNMPPVAANDAPHFETPRNVSSSMPNLLTGATNPTQKLVFNANNLSPPSGAAAGAGGAGGRGGGGSSQGKGGFAPGILNMLLGKQQQQQQQQQSSSGNNNNHNNNQRSSMSRSVVLVLLLVVFLCRAWLASGLANTRV